MMAIEPNTWAWLRVGGVALVCAGVALSVSACQSVAGAATSTGASATVAPPTSTSAPHKGHRKGTGNDGGAATGQGKGVTGQISAENGTSWTVTTKAGQQMTVTITTATKFGTTAQPATEQQFPVGSTVRVTGQVQGSQVAATRIVSSQSQPGQDATPSATSYPGATT